MSDINYVVSNLRTIKNVEKSFFHAQYCAYKYGLDIESNNVAKFLDYNKEQVQSFWDYTEIKYLKYLNIIGSRLNNLHCTNYSNIFWKRVFSLDLLRFISGMHQFYIYASKNFDLKKHTCSILSEKSYKIVDDFYEQRELLNSSCFGQEQLLSLYLKCFYPNTFPEFEWENNNSKINSNIKLNIKKYFNIKNYTKTKIVKKFYQYSDNIKYSDSKASVGIMGSFFDKLYFQVLKEKSSGKIKNILIPNLSYEKNVDFEMRTQLSQITPDMDDFDKFFFFSLKFLIPKYLVENFTGSIKNIKQHLEKFKNLKFLISEAWMGSSSINLFRSFAYEKQGVQTFHNEHNCIFHPYVGNLVNIKAQLVDKYLTFGWDNEDPKFVKLASLFPFTKEIKKKKFDILYISNPARYRRTFYSSSYGHSGDGAIKQLKFVSTFFKKLSPELLKKISYREYPKDYSYQSLSYDKELILKDDLKDIKKLSSYRFQGETCKDQMASSSIVIIDFLSTSYLESLKMNIPTICFLDSESMFLSNKYSNFFKDLLEAKIIHLTPMSASEHLKKIHSNPLQWWNSPNTQNLKNHWLNNNFGNPDTMVKYLLELSEYKN
ncbi:LIC12162 family protein [Candidatus Pelagibacter sp.]|nr:LIC12162 family protein [Candidatus Pelagibacter sp.]